jgi:OOP family OmpA-OmpF porin
VKLAEPLHRGTVYEFSMQVRLAFWSNCVLRSFGALFSKGSYREGGYTKVFTAVRSNFIDTVCEKGGLGEGYRWFTIKGFYKADGGEKYLCIGNFAPFIRRDMVRIDVFKFGAKEAYYFVDNVRLVKAPQFDEKVAIERVGPNYQEEWADSTLAVKENIEVGEKVQLNNIFFVNGRYYLLPESYTELNKLSQYLIEHPTIEIRINGHSDNTGLKHRNQRMSELRAREVFEYLIKRGVQNKMYYKGFGSTQPVAGNETEQGRQKNRRVEFEIIKK